MVNKKVLEELGQYAPFENCDWEIRVKGTTDHDPRVMTFVDNLWGFEITGGGFFSEKQKSRLRKHRL